MDKELLHAILPELHAALAGARISKIHQPSADTLIFRLWTGRENLRLLVSTGRFSRIHLTEKDYPNPFTPPRFCQLLRARIRRFVAISQVADDRVVRIDASGPDGEVTLYAELFGASGNLLLVDTGGTIIDALDRRRGRDGERSLLPGEPYRLPPASPAGGPDRQEALPAGEGDLSSRLDEYYYPLQFQSGQLGDRGELKNLLQKEQKRLKRRLANIEREGEDKESFDDRRRLGDLLLANLHLVRRGMEAVRVTDYTADPPVEVEIPLDPRLSPQENAEALFRRYKKEKRGVDHVTRRRQETEEELAWLEQVRLALDEAETPEDLREVAEELRQAGLYRPVKVEPATRRKLSATPALRQATSPGGFTILWGRNNRANDYLTTRVAAAHDYWFHAHGVPGCHLVLKRDSEAVAVPDADLDYAAGIAAGYCRARTDRMVEVIVCLARDVYKVKGAHPGQVGLRRFETRAVAPLRPDESDENE